MAQKSGKTGSPDRDRFSANRTTDAVLRLLRGEDRRRTGRPDPPCAGRVAVPRGGLPQGLGPAAMTGRLHGHRASRRLMR